MSGSRRAILHIGMPRTGTTSIQHVLSGLRSQLARQGILYPDLTPRSALQPHLSHQHLGETLDGRRRRRERAELLARLEAWLQEDGIDTLILSYEGLALAPRRLALPRRFNALFQRHGFAMETLVTVKPQAEYLNSMYTWRTQFLKEGRVFSRFLRAARHWPRFDYGALVRPWAAASAGRLHVVPVRDQRSELDLITRFFEAARLLPRVAPLLGPHHAFLAENRSPPALAVEVARRLQLRGGGIRLGPLAREATRLVEQLVDETGLANDGFQGMDEPARETIRSHFARRNDRFADLAWGAPWESRVADEPPRKVNEIATEPTDPATEATIGEILRQTELQYGLLSPPGAAVRLRRAAAFVAGFIKQN